MAYYLVSVSNRMNLDLCIRYAMAGFTNSINGLWTFIEIQEGDYISFLYGARVFNLYKVVKKEAVREPEKLPPWPPVTFKVSGKTYHFPFRLYLRPVRKFNEPMVRPEFAYVAENLLLRGGYRKTHFQADQTTLQSVSQMGATYNEPVENLLMPNYETFTPMITWNGSIASPPEVFRFHEFILQALVKSWLSDGKNLQFLLNFCGLDKLRAEDFEVLSEKALPEGHVDILIKERTPIGQSVQIIVEVKAGRAHFNHIAQLKNYVLEMGEECREGILIAQEFPRRVQKLAEAEHLKCFVYSLGQIDRNKCYSVTELQKQFQLLPLKG